MLISHAVNLAIEEQHACAGLVDADTPSAKMHALKLWLSPTVLDKNAMGGAQSLSLCAAIVSIEV